MSGNRPKVIAAEPQMAWLKELEAKLSSQYHVIGTTQLERVLPLLRSERDVTAILVSTSKNSEVVGILEAAQRERPDVLRVLLTGFENLNLVVEGLHSGAVQRVISRPIQYAELLGVMRKPDAAPTILRSA